jgi:membrane-associated phospholipid phosphatase
LLPLILFLVLWALIYVPLAGVGTALKRAAKRISERLARTRLAKWVTGRSAWSGLRSYAVMLVLLAAGALAATVAGYLFMELAVHLNVSKSLVYEMDRVVEAGMQSMRQPAVTTLLTTITRIGGFAGMAPLALVVAAILFIHQERASAVFIIVTVAGGELLNLGLKTIFARTRPDLALAIYRATGYSYPSGHAMGSFITFGAISYIVLRQPWIWRLKSAVLAFAATMVILISLSRIYLGVHWTSDILGAWSASTVWLASAIVAFEMLLRLRERRRGAAPTSQLGDVPDKPVPQRRKTA